MYLFFVLDCKLLKNKNLLISKDKIGANVLFLFEYLKDFLCDIKLLFLNLVPKSVLRALKMSILGS